MIGVDSVLVGVSFPWSYCSLSHIWYSVSCSRLHGVLPFPISVYKWYSRLHGVIPFLVFVSMWYSLHHDVTPFVVSRFRLSVVRIPFVVSAWCDLQRRKPHLFKFENPLTLHGVIPI